MTQICYTYGRKGRFESVLEPHKHRTLKGIDMFNSNVVQICLQTFVVCAVLYVVVGLFAALVHLMVYSWYGHMYPEAAERRVIKKYGDDFKKAKHAIYRTTLLVFLLWPIQLGGRKKDWFKWI